MVERQLDLLAIPAEPSRGATLRLHLGCGRNLKEGWVNVDLFTDGSGVALDVRETWPFADGSASIVFAEHVSENLEHPVETEHFLRESLRVLKPGGVLSFSVPDAESAILSYTNPAAEYWEESKRWRSASCRTRLDHINYQFRQNGEHKYAWHSETLLAAIESVGSSRFRRREFEPGLDHE
jgi:predicted SAM-dependent methyltransferase